MYLPRWYSNGARNERHLPEKGPSFMRGQAASLVTRRAVPDCGKSFPNRGETGPFFGVSSNTRMRELLSHSSTSLGTAITALRAFPRGLRTGRASSRSHLCTVLTPRPM
jgi:hypothetical protein